MGLILDTSVLIADERGKFDMPGFLRQFPAPQPLIAAITVQPFDLAQARCHARLWADLERRGSMIGAHDLQIAAAGLALGHDVATLNASEFQRVAGLHLVDATPFRRP